MLSGGKARKELLLQFRSKGHLLAEFPLAQGRPVFSSIQTFNSLDEAHPHYEEQSALLKVHPYTLISSKIPLTETSRVMFEHISGHCLPARLTEKMNYYSIFSILILEGLVDIR